jgi:hypothetical protein
MFALALKASFGVFLLILASLGIGSWISRNLACAFSQLDKLAFGLLGGFGLLSLVLFLVGQFSFTRRTIMIVLGLVIVASAKPLLSLKTHTAILVQTLRKAPKIPLFLIFLIISLTSVVGLGEVTGDWNSDTVAYHLLGPKVWLRNGVIRPVADNCHTAFPQTAETMYGALFGIGGERAPRFLSFVTFGMLLLAAASLAVRSGLNASEAWWVAALIATMPAVYNGSVGCFVDGIYAAFVLAAIRIGIDAETKRDWAIFGIFCGLAMGTKYTGILAFPVLMLCVVWIHASQGTSGWRETSKAAVVAICIACMVASPYYLRNWILLRCPIYPPPLGLAHICSPKYLSPEVVAGFHAYIRQRGEGLGRGIAALFLLPFNLTYHTSSFHGAGGIGLAPLALAPIGLIACRKNPIVKMLSVLGLLLLLAWFATQQESRFLIHFYVITSILGVLGWRHLNSSHFAVSRILATTIVLASVSYGMFMIGRYWPEDTRMVISSEYAHEVRNRRIPFLESFQYLNTSPAVRRILILDRSVTPFYLDKDYVKPVGQWGERTLPGAMTALDALENVRELGISHVLDVNSEVSPFQITEHNKGLTLVVDSQNQRVYRVD